MLTDEEKFINKKNFYELLMHLEIDLTELSNYLDEINYFEKPATALYRRNYAGGLCEQALIFYKELSILCNAYFPGKYSEKDIIKVSLFAEIFRASLYEFYRKNVKNDTTGQWESIGAYKTNENCLSFGEVGFSSYMIAKRYIDFTEEQSLAIIYGAYTASVNPVNDYKLMENFPLITLAKMANLATISF